MEVKGFILNLSTDNQGDHNDYFSLLISRTVLHNPG
jgi:hypothetical protein